MIRNKEATNFGLPTTVYYGIDNKSHRTTSSKVCCLFDTYWNIHYKRLRNKL